jgi:hypothetical protein
MQQLNAPLGTDSFKKRDFSNFTSRTGDTECCFQMLINLADDEWSSATCWRQFYFLGVNIVGLLLSSIGWSIRID